MSENMRYHSADELGVFGLLYGKVGQLFYEKTMKPLYKKKGNTLV